MRSKPVVLITGGLGFIGTNLALFLQDHYQIRVLDNNISGSQNSPLLDGFAEIIYGDIQSLETCDHAMLEVDFVVHLAAKGSVVESMQDPYGNLQSNVVGTLNILQAAAKHGIKRLVFSSTGGALMGNTQPPVNELSIPKPISPYGASKLACEGYCSAFSASYGLPITVLRFGNVYGEHSLHKKGVVNKILECLQTDAMLNVFGDGQASRDFIHVSDICTAIHLALNNSKDALETYHIATGIESTLLALIEVAEYVAGKSLSLVQMPARNGEVLRNFSSYQHAQARLGYYPKVSMHQGIARMWDWINGR